LNHSSREFFSHQLFFRDDIPYLGKREKNAFDHCFLSKKITIPFIHEKKFDNDGFCHYDEESNAVVVFENTDKIGNEKKQDIRHRTR